MRLIILLLGLCACEELDYPDINDANPDGNTDMSVPEPSWNASGRNGSGSLPPAFFERGCAVDAPCGGPLPGDFVSRPVQ